MLRTALFTLLDLAETVDGTEGVSLVPAFVGLGAPHWNAEARGLVAGLSFGSKPAHLARAAAESMALQVHDVFDIVQHAAGAKIGRLFVDGGPSSNRFLMSLVSGYLDHPVIMCETTEASALGAAYLAGLSTGVWDDLTTVSGLAGERTPLSSQMDPGARQEALANWKSGLIKWRHEMRAFKAISWLSLAVFMFAATLAGGKSGCRTVSSPARSAMVLRTR